MIESGRGRPASSRGAWYRARVQLLPPERIFVKYSKEMTPTPKVYQQQYLKKVSVPKIKSLQFLCSNIKYAQILDKSQVTA